MTVAELTAKISVVGEAAAVRALSRVGQSARSVGEAIRTAADATRLFEIAQNSMASVSGVQAAMAYDSQVRGLAAYAKNAQELQAQLARLQEIAKLPGLGLKEVRAGVLQLEAAGLNAQIAERAMMAFGNALALAGRGKSDLEGAMLQLSQMASAGKLAGDELNVIAERVPQIRQVLKAAFGTASTEDINKMGLSINQIIEKMVAGLEQLPKASAGAITTMENLQDSLEQAFLPIGRGILDIFSSAEGGTMRLIERVAEMGKQIGEVFSAIGKSGVIQDFLNRVIGAFGPGGNFQQAMINVAANLLAFFAQLPRILQELGPAIMTFFGDIGYNIKAFFMNTFGDLETNIVEVAQMIESQIKDVIKNLSSFKIFGVPVAEGPSAGIAGMGGPGELTPPETKRPVWNYITPRFPMPAAGDVPDLAGEYGRMIREMLGPQGLPPGMIYGGGQGSGGGIGGSSIQEILGKIANNTKTAADALTLRRETLGGGQLGQLGVTAAEMSGSMSTSSPLNMGDFFGGGNRGLIPAGTELERSIRSMIRDEARKNGTPGIMRRF
jgi:tape measure domain-containing protein